MLIAHEDFETCLAQLADDRRHEAIGLFGPGSTMWRLARESVIMFGGGRAALLQAAHPHIAWAVTSQSSAVMSDVAGRFRRTFDNVFAMTFGPRDKALRRARRVRTIHEHVHGVIGEDIGRFRRGDRYEALDAEAALWVAATLWDTTIYVFELVFGPLAPRDKALYYAESRKFAALFGLRDDALPEDWPAFQRWMEQMLASDTIRVGQAARLVCEHITTAPRRASVPAYRWLASFTAGIMPADLREAYGLPWSRRDRAVFHATLPALRTGVQLLPPQLRYFPGYLDARRRVDGLDGRDRVGQLVERLVMQGLSKEPAR